jgi:GGDEF domain-containing protein
MRSTVLTGPAAQLALRTRLRERLRVASPSGNGTDRYFSLAVVEVDPVTTAGLEHPGGRERLLTALGRRLADATRPTDLVVRPTAGRFVLVLNGVRDSYGLAAARRRIADVLSRPVLIDGRPVRTTVAVGVLPAGPEDTVDDLLGRLAEAATRDRRSGRRLRSVGLAEPPV